MNPSRALRCLALTTSLLAFVLGGFAGCGGGDDSSPPVDGGSSDATTDATTDACSAADLQTDAKNCGSCGNVCGSGNVCESGACVAPCLIGQSRCDGRCVAFATDNVNCGACGNVCSTGLVCSNGTCATTCAPPLSTCSSGESSGQSGDAGLVDAATDAATDAAADAAADAASEAGTFPDASAADAAAPQAARYCASTGSDQDNCGACGVVCAAGQQCVGGTCSDTCAIGETLCGAGTAASCRDLATDLANCGTCGTTCAAGQVCSGGVCQADCGLPFTRCGDICSNLANDPTHCGGCGTSCAPVNAKAPACVAGACTFVGCQPGFSDCDGDAANGCELSTRADPKNCGGCGVQCGGVNEVASACTGGSCGFTACQPGFGDCDGNASDGCETDLTSVAHCGKCQTACASGDVCTTAGACTGASSASYLVPDFGAAVTLPTAIPVWTVTSTSAAATIFYTLDGSTPTTASPHVENTLTLNGMVAPTDGSSTTLSWFTFDGATSAVQTRTITTSSAVQQTKLWTLVTNMQMMGATSGTQAALVAAYPGESISLTFDLRVSDPAGGTAYGDAVVVGTTGNSGCTTEQSLGWPGDQTSSYSISVTVPDAAGVYPITIVSTSVPYSQQTDACTLGNSAWSSAVAAGTAPIVGYVVVAETTE